MLMGAITGLALAVAGCERPQVTPGTNPNPMFGYVNLSNSLTGHRPGLIVDEDRDGTPEYIAYEPTVSGTADILFVRQGYKPNHPSFMTTPRTGVMDYHMLLYAKQSLRDEHAVNYAIQHANKQKQ